MAAVGGADLGGLAHLLLKLSSDAVVLLDAQRKRLGRFLGLELRLAREKRKISGAGCGRLVHKPGIRNENEWQCFFLPLATTILTITAGLRAKIINKSD